MVRHLFWILSFVFFTFVAIAANFWPGVLYSLIILIPLFFLGVYDILQRRWNILRLYPLVGHLRHMLQSIRPQIQQYFIETNTNGTPFSREDRELVYFRSQNKLDTLPFGTQRDIYRVGYEWINHSMVPKVPMKKEPRLWVGTDQCDKPYSSSVLNISAMSFGALSKNAVMAMNLGAAMGGFAQNTGEGGISPYHLKGGDLIWQIGTAYFGCRDAHGRFDETQYKEQSTMECVKMIEVKLSQGAKPGKGGILPGKKVSKEIAKIRGIPAGQDVISPPAHSAFSTPKEMLNFFAKLRDISGGKPVGFKFCVGHRRQFLALCKAMIETNSFPDFISVDGGEGGTGAAPLEFSNSVGMPLNDGLIFVHNALVGFNIRDKIKIIASGKITTGFHIAANIAMGADLCNIARAMMFAVGCIQAVKCNTNHCPVGVTTQDPWLVNGLVVEEKKFRVANFHRQTIKSFLSLLAAAGLSHPSELKSEHIYRRISMTEIKHYNEIFSYLETGDLLKEPLPKNFVKPMLESSAESF